MVIGSAALLSSVWFWRAAATTAMKLSTAEEPTTTTGFGMSLHSAAAAV